MIRETPNYTVEKSARGYRITAKDAKSTPRSRVVSERLWNQLKGMSDSEFDGSVVLEIGIGTFTR